MPFNHFDFISGIYDRWGHFDPHHPLLELLELPERGLIVDVGGGTGRVAQTLAGLGMNVMVVDNSAGMLLKVRGKRGLTPILADSADLPFHSATVDRALIVDALHHIRCQQATIDELCRVLKKGGVAVVDEPDLRSFAVKLIVVGEFVLLMGSHFLTQRQLLELFSGKQGELDSRRWRGSVLVKYQKVEGK